MRRVVGAMRDAKLAFVAEVGEILKVPVVETVRLSVHIRAVERAEEDVEGRAEVVAAAARVADVCHTPQLGRHRGGFVKVVGRRVKQERSPDCSWTPGRSTTCL